MTENIVVVKKHTCFLHSNFSHWPCFFPHNYLQYLLNSLGTPTVRKNKKWKAKREGAVEGFTFELSGPCGHPHEWWPFGTSRVWNASCVLTLSLPFKISTYSSDILLNVFGKYLEDFPVHHFVKIFILSFGVINLNFCFMNFGKKMYIMKSVF